MFRISCFSRKNNLMSDLKKSALAIDVVIPAYNGENFILDALKSAINQTLPPHKIIIVDDGSTDKTNEMVSEYAKTSKINIEIIKKTNGGLSSARNAGIKASNAEFVAFLDADDMWDKEKLEKQLDVFQNTEFKNLGLVYCDYDLIKTNGEKDIESYKVPLDKKARGFVFKKILQTNKILSSSSGVLIKRNVFNIVGFFDENLRFAEDWDMWIRIAEKFEVDYRDEKLARIRRHEESMSRHIYKVFLGDINFFNKWVPKLRGQHLIPLEWSDKIIFRIIKMPRRRGMIKEL